MNKIMLLGRLVRDPEVRYTTTGKVVCQFTLAVDRPFTNQDGQREADFINIVVWGKTAELCGNSLMKGHRHYVTEVVANGVEFIERKGYTPGNGGEAGSGRSDMESFGSQVPFDEEIPF